MKKIKELDFVGANQNNDKVLLLFMLLFALIICPGNAFAGGGVTEFAGPLEKVIAIFQGPVGAAFSIITFIIAMMSYVIKQGEFSDTVKGFVHWVLPISGICFAGSFVTYLFQFTGAVI